MRGGAADGQKPSLLLACRFLPQGAHTLGTPTHTCGALPGPFCLPSRRTAPPETATRRGREHPLL